MTWGWKILFETMFDQIHSQLDLDKEILYWFFHQGLLKHASLQILVASLQVEIVHKLKKKIIEVKSIYNNVLVSGI